MKNKWLWITLSVLLVLVLLAGTAFIFLRIGMMRSVVEVKVGDGVVTEGCCELSESGEGPILGAEPGKNYGFRGMMGQYFDRFDRFSYNPRSNMMGSRISMFSPLRWLGGLVLLAVLVLLVILIVKALTGKTKLIVKTQPEVVEVPPVDHTEQL